MGSGTAQKFLLSHCTVEQEYMPHTRAEAPERPRRGRKRSQTSYQKNLSRRRGVLQRRDLHFWSQHCMGNRSTTGAVNYRFLPKKIVAGSRKICINPGRFIWLSDSCCEVRIISNEKTNKFRDLFSLNNFVSSEKAQRQAAMTVKKQMSFPSAAGNIQILPKTSP